MRERLRIIITGLLILNFGMFVVIVVKTIRQTHLQQGYVKADFIRDYYATNPAPASTLILGDSITAFGITPLAFEKAVSLAIPGATHMTVLAEWVRYRKSHPAPNCLLVATAGNQEYYKLFGELFLRNALFTLDQADSLFVNSAKDQRYPSVAYSRFAFLTAMFIERYILPSPTLLARASLALGLKTSETTLYTEIKHSIEENRGFLSRNRRAPSKPMADDYRFRHLFHEFQPDETDDYYLNQIAKHLEQERIPLIYVQMPTLPSAEPQPPVYMNARMEHIRQILAPYPNAHIVQIPAPSNSDDFRDAIHLSNKGAIDFSNRLATTVSQFCQNADKASDSP